MRTAGILFASLWHLQLLALAFLMSGISPTLSTTVSVQPSRNLSNLEVAKMDCSSEVQLFPANLLIEVSWRPYDNNDINSTNYTNSNAAASTTTPSTNITQASPAAQVYQEIQLWKQVVQRTYNSLMYHKCDSPQFRRIIGLQVEELYSTKPHREDRGTKLLRFSLELECRGGRYCELTAKNQIMFAPLPFDETIVVVDTDVERYNSGNTTLPALPKGWSPPSYQQLQEPPLQVLEEGQCLCRASADTAVLTYTAGTTTTTRSTHAQIGAPSQSQFVLSLNTTLQGLQEEGFFPDYRYTIDRLVQVTEDYPDRPIDDDTCPEEIVSIESKLLIHLDESLDDWIVAFKEKNGNITYTATNDTTILALSDFAQALQVAYNQVALFLCDQPKHRRIVKVALDDNPEDKSFRFLLGNTRLPIAIQAECNGCTAEDVQNQAWLFHDQHDDEQTKNMTLLSDAILTLISENMPESPVLTCDCLFGNHQQTKKRAPMVEEVLTIINKRLLQQVISASTTITSSLEKEAVNVTNSTTKADHSVLPMPPYVTWIDQVQEYDCLASQNSKVSYTNVSVNFTGNPQDLTADEIKSLEVAFAQTYNAFSFRQCDTKFRQISTVQLLVLPKKATLDEEKRRMLLTVTEIDNDDDLLFYNDTLIDGNTTANSTMNVTLNTTDSAYINVTNSTWYYGNTTTANINDIVPPITVSTSIFRVSVECRRCPADDTETFGLFDSFARRLRQRHPRALNDNAFSAFAGFENYIQKPSTIQPQDVTCYCPAGVTPQEGMGLLDEAFLEYFQEAVEVLFASENIKGIELVESVEEVPYFCFDDLVEANARVVLDFVEYDDYRNVSLYTREEVQFAFLVAANSVRESDCAPLVKKVGNVNIVSAPASPISRQGETLFGTATVLLEVDADVLETESDTLADHLMQHKDEVLQNFWAVALMARSNRPAEDPTSPTTPVKPDPAPSPTPDPTQAGTTESTYIPTESPTAGFKSIPTDYPSSEPSSTPSEDPSRSPSEFPSANLSLQGSINPIGDQSGAPTMVLEGSQPKAIPTDSSDPSASPSETSSPTTQEPTMVSGHPSIFPSIQEPTMASDVPSAAPITLSPTTQEPTMASDAPSAAPITLSPTTQKPTMASDAPSAAPITLSPTTQEPTMASDAPSLFPSVAPTEFRVTVVSMDLFRTGLREDYMETYTCGEFVTIDLNTIDVDPVTGEGLTFRANADANAGDGPFKGVVFTAINTSGVEVWKRTEIKFPFSLASNSRNDNAMISSDLLDTAQTNLRIKAEPFGQKGLVAVSCEITVTVIERMV